MKQPEKSMI
uniref:Uncharacterized protein n=1 Tax=Rhizophora mucronata TaxID=61149 RepID=A0A2P2N7I3_RHIMU